MTEHHLPRADRMPGQLACPLDDDAHVTVRNAVVLAHKPLVEKLAYTTAWKHARAGSYGNAKQRFAARIGDFINCAWEEALREFHNWDPGLGAFGAFVRPVIQRALYAFDRSRLLRGSRRRSGSILGIPRSKRIPMIPTRPGPLVMRWSHCPMVRSMRPAGVSAIW